MNQIELNADRYHLNTVINRLSARKWFHSGVHAIVDGQFGSTGKGVIASVLECTLRGIHGDRIHFAAETNAGPNSGHTAVFNGHQMITRQLPISAVQNRWVVGEESRAKAYLNAGAVIDIGVLLKEVEEFKMEDRVIVHPNAAIIEEVDLKNEAEGGPVLIASTGKGVGSAIARKVMRENLCASSATHRLAAKGVSVLAVPHYSFIKPIILEVAQGFSLGINQCFYPYSTSRECTIMQALSDACIHPFHLKKTMMALRTYPIRVGNTDMGNSGSMYPDQRETSWEELGQEPELTTVTKRIRRVFTWSWMQFEEAVIANRPDALFVNFCNYLAPGAVDSFVETILEHYEAIINRPPDAVILGWGPETHQVTLWDK